MARGGCAPSVAWVTRTDGCAGSLMSTTRTSFGSSVRTYARVPLVTTSRTVPVIVAVCANADFGSKTIIFPSQPLLWQLIAIDAHAAPPADAIDGGTSDVSLIVDVASAFPSRPYEVTVRLLWIVKTFVSLAATSTISGVRMPPVDCIVFVKISTLRPSKK